MKKKNRIARPKEELRVELADQLALVRHSCDSFDKGLEAIGKHLSLSLRVLLHQHRQSRALLEQLGLRNKRFLDTAGPLNPNNLMAECNLVGGSVSLGENGSSAKYLALVQMGGAPIPARRVPFVRWWNDPVMKDNAGHLFCRRELVSHVANTDGGAHVDPDLDAEYMHMSRSNGLGWVLDENGLSFGTGPVAEGSQGPEGRLELVCMRQIAHEVLETINSWELKWLEV